MKQETGISPAVEANRQGHLTSEQEQKLRDDYMLPCNIASGIIFGCVAAAVILIFAGFSSVYGGPYGLLFVPLLAIVIIAAYSYSEGQLQNLQADLTKGGVKSIAGKIRLDVLEGNQRGVSYFVRIGKSSWRVSKVQFLSFSNGETYRLYYVPRSHSLLSFERLDEVQNLNAEIATNAAEKRKHQQYTLSGDGELVEVSNDIPAQPGAHGQRSV